MKISEKQEEMLAFIEDFVVKKISTESVLLEIKGVEITLKISK